MLTLVLHNIWSVMADDWKNFKERFSGLEESDKRFVERMSGLDVAGDQKKIVAQKKEDARQLCLWASYRGQTLARTVRGMMYYERSGLILCYDVHFMGILIWVT